jgi:hypothetical protein
LFLYQPGAPASRLIINFYSLWSTFSAQSQIQVRFTSISSVLETLDDVFECWRFADKHSGVDHVLEVFAQHYQQIRLGWSPG